MTTYVLRVISEAIVPVLLCESHLGFDSTLSLDSTSDQTRTRTTIATASTEPRNDSTVLATAVLLGTHIISRSYNKILVYQPLCPVTRKASLVTLP
jgi:hypothetical protein